MDFRTRVGGIPSGSIAYCGVRASNTKKLHWLADILPKISGVPKRNFLGTMSEEIRNEERAI